MIHADWETKSKHQLKGKSAMMNKLLICFALAGVAVLPGFSQNRTAATIKEAKAGEEIQLRAGLTAKVSKSNSSSFASVKVKGEAVVVTIELDAGQKGAMILYKPAADSQSEIYLTGASGKLAPRAVIEDFPSLGSDNDKELEVLDPKEGPGGGSIDFQGKGFISLLFDIPPSQARTPMKLSVTVRSIKPKPEQHSFVVSM